MNFLRQKILRFVSVLATILVLGGTLVVSVMSRNQPTLGFINGKLRDCPSSPNCVCSHASTEAKQIQPIVYGTASGMEMQDDKVDQQAFDRLHGLLEEWPRVDLMTTDRKQGYIHAVFTTTFLRFRDDVEFLLDPSSQVIHVRSASRVGHSDFGTNRRRVEAIRKAFAVESAQH